MADLRQHDPLVEAVAKARKVESQRPDIKFPMGGLNQINGHVYSYSGSTTDGGSGSAATLMSQFVTGADAIKGTFQISNRLSSGHDFYLDIWFNDFRVVQIKEDSSDVEGWPITIELILPPFTKVETKWGANTSGSSAETNFIGEVI